MAKKEGNTLRGVDAETFETFLKKNAGKMYEEAVGAEIDIHKIIDDILKNNADSSPTVGVSLFNSAVMRELDEIDSETVQGVFVGMRDRYQKNYPAHMCILDLENGGTGFEVSTWDTRLMYNGVREQIPEPCYIRMSVKRNKEYGNFEATSVEEYKPMTDDQFREFLKPIAINPGETSTEDKYQVLVFKGIVDKVQPVSRFEEKEAVGVYRVVESNGLTNPIPHPVFQIRLLKSASSDGVDTIATVIFDRCRNTVPNIMVDDIIDLCNEAVTRYTEPRSQAEWVQNGLRGREVLIVGIVTSYKFVRDNQYGETAFVNIGGVCILDLNPPIGIGEAEPQPEPEKPKEKKRSRRSAKEEPKEEKAKETPKEEKRVVAPTQGAGIETIVEKIIDYCDTLKITPDDISLGEVIEKIESDATAAVVNAALKRARDLCRKV